MNSTIYTSDQLTVGDIYSRSQLRTIFSITDATINSGVFQPKGTKSVWLFITEEKSDGSVTYVNQLKDNTLTINGQTAGRTDQKLIGHAQDNIELLVFYRKNKNQYDDYAFKYEGEFIYTRHSGHKPASFVLSRKTADQFIEVIQDQLDNTKEFHPADPQDGKKRVMTSIALRRGQKTFRNKLITAYSGQCAVTGCTLVSVLEAAHILPYNGSSTNHIQNGLLLRADIHTLFDLSLLSVNPDTYEIWISAELHDTEYAQYQGKLITLPAILTDKPSKPALSQHFKSSIDQLV